MGVVYLIMVRIGILVVLVSIVGLFGFVTAEELVNPHNGRVSLVNPNTLRMDWDDRVRIITDSPIILIGDNYGIAFWESDPDLGVDFGYSRGLISLYANPNPAIVVPGYSLFYCTNEPISQYSVYRVDSSKCDGFFYSYQLPDVAPRETRYLIPPSHETGFKWFIGNGAGGGGGSLCLGVLYAAIQRNESSTYVGNTFLMKGAGEYTPGGAHLCALNLITWQVYRDDTSSYGIIPTTYIATVMLSGNGTVMSQGSPNNAVFYNRYPLCEENNTRNIRVKVDGTVDGRASAVYSAVYSHVCVNPPSGGVCYCNGEYCEGDGDWVLTNNTYCPIGELVPLEGDLVLNGFELLVSELTAPGDFLWG